MKNTLRETSVAAMKSLLAFILAVCMVMTALPEVAVAATSSGYYIRPVIELTLTLSSGSKTVKVNSSHVLEMVSKDKVTVSGTQYEVYQVYYGGEKYNVPASTVNASCIKPVSEVDGYAMSTLWKANPLPSLKKANNLTADMNTYAMQLALKTLGYLSDAPDGGFGDVTDAAVKKYQKDAGLQQDGVAGPQTLTALYKAALKKVEGVTQYVITTKDISLKSGTVVPAGKVMKMVQNYADASNPAYYIVSYKGYTDCRVLISDVQTKAVIVTDLDSYIVKNVWTTNTFTSLKESENITNDLHVHAAQYALTYLGYSTETTHDGSYGTKTVEAVKKFQTATGNVVDGVAGAVTLKALYAAALAKWNTANATPTPTPKPTATPTPKPTTTTTSSATATPTPTPTSSIATTGTLRTLTKVNLRETRSTNGLRLGSVPEGTTLTYYDARVESSGTWYKVIYKNNTGWLLGTFVTTDLTSGSTSNLLPNGSIRTTSKVNMRKETTTNSFRLGSVPENTILYYSDTAVVNGITWYKVSYSGETGWIMGTYTSIYTTNTTTTTNTLLPTGSVRTTAKVNIRETASTGAKRLGSVPENVILSYLDTSIVSGVTWYKITYKGETGWIMGTYTSNYYAGGTTTSTGTSSPTAGTLKTTSKVNLRKKASSTSTRLDQVPAGVNLSYTTTTVVNGVTWYYVTYNGESGWLMGTFVTAKGSSTSPAIGTVTITKGGTHVRDAANGNKTGVNLSKGTTVDLIASPVTSGGYTWYNIRTSSGVVGFVRGDCASISSNTGTSGGTGSSTNTTVYSNKLFLYAGTGSIFFKTTTKPATGYKTLSSDAILMLAADTTYTKDGKEYVSVYYRNEVYNAEYVETDDFFIMDTTELSYALETAFETELGETLKQSMDLVGDFRVYALQLGLQTLGLYTGNLDGSYGAGTTSAVRNLQRQTGLKVDGECGKNTWNALAARIGYININGGGTIAPSTPAGTFGAVTSVQKLYWDFDNDCTAEFPKYSYATVMDVETKKVFTVYRWAGANHADCVPATEADTKIMCEIAGFTYNSSRPSSSQKSLIIGDDANNNTNYTWPDFRGSFGGSGLSNKSDWDRRPVLVNIGGKVYPASIFGWPHGYLGENKGVGAMTLGGKDSCCDYNNYYGMMCIHFYNSTTHGGTSGASSGHLAAVNKAWDYAKSVWPTLVK